MNNHRYFLRNFALSAGAALSLGACVSVLPEAEPPSYLARMPAESGVPVTGELNTRVIVNRPESTGALAGAAIATAEDGGLIYIKQVRWADAPSKMLESALVDQLAALDGEGWAASVKSGARGDFEIRWSIRDLSFDMDRGDGVCEVRISLIDARQRNVIATDRLIARVPSTTMDDESRARAIAAAMSNIAKQSAQFAVRHAIPGNIPERGYNRAPEERTPFSDVESSETAPSTDLTSAQAG